MAPSLKPKLARLSAKWKIQDGAQSTKVPLLTSWAELGLSAGRDS